MKLEFIVDDKDNAALVSFYAAYKNRVFVQQREKRNVWGTVPAHTREDLWITMAMCLLTSQQRSGPYSPISKFLLAKPFSISLEECSKVEDLQSFVLQKLVNFGGIRFGPTLAQRISNNYAALKSGEWERLEGIVAELEVQRQKDPSPFQYLLERQAARYMQKTFLGFGPKQSRNFWQSLGLSRYEFVLDSRVLKWLRDFGFPFPLSSMALGEEDYYCYISDILHDWCLRVGVIPCILDAAIFASYDTEEWPEDAAVW
jgi:hypothetical protein